MKRTLIALFFMALATMQLSAQEQKQVKLNITFPKAGESYAVSQLDKVESNILFVAAFQLDGNQAKMLGDLTLSIKPVEPKDAPATKIEVPAERPQIILPADKAPKGPLEFTVTKKGFKEFKQVIKNELPYALTIVLTPEK